MRALKLTLAYDGTPFVGWQRQGQGTSIQGLLEDALARIEGDAVAVVGAGRTDAGVHAIGQVASCAVGMSHDTATICRALNAMLPPEVRVLSVRDVDALFNARHSATSKTYRYHIVNGPIASPFEWRYAWHVSESLDFDRMQAAAARLEGEHDFAAFRSTGSSVATSRRRVDRSLLFAADPPCPAPPTKEPAEGFERSRRLVYQVTASGFLRHMVRAIVGTLVEIGAGRRDLASVDRALASGVRTDAGPTAPARGLWLVRVDYGNEADKSRRV